MSKEGGTAPLNPSDDTLRMMVHVTAPANLPGGYTFEAEIHGDKEKTFTCEVPENGVEEGQVFLAPLPASYNGPHLRAPVGQWKDGLFDCFSTGICHPSLWCAWFCTQVAMGQVMSRATLTWLGEPGTLASTKQTFCVVVTLTVSYMLYSTFLELAMSPYDPELVPMGFTVAQTAGNVLFTVWAIYALMRTRKNIRARYQIKEEHCKGCEDLCCAVWCGCCVTAQLLRHTGEYETYPATCCTSTGHPPNAPLVV